MNKKDALPVIVASVIALVITAIVKWLMPSSSGPAQQIMSKDIAMPEIPLMAKKEKKEKKEDLVLFVSGSFKKDEKIILDRLKWEKWPSEAMQPYFIAKTQKGVPLNNGADFSNALKMWANTDIPSGIPLTMSMLTKEDPVQKKKEAQQKKKEQAAKKLEKEKKESFIRKGMRAVTFQVDQRSASSSSMIKPGDLVDILIMDQSGSKNKIHKYKAMRIIAIDGVTKFDNKQKKNDSGGGFLGSVSIVNNFLTPKNVTLEVREDMVELMLKQAGSSGVILSIRSQEEGENETFSDDFASSQENNENLDYILQNILNINDTEPGDVQLQESAKRKKEEEDMTMLMNNIISMNSKESMDTEKAKTDKSEGSSERSSSNGTKGTKSGGKYEIVSGKVVGKENQEEAEKNSATVYKKLTASKVEFGEDGKPKDNGGSGLSSLSSSLSSGTL